MSDIVFLDTETLGVHIDAPIWELAAVRRRPDGTEAELHIYVDHDPEPWMSDPKFPGSFKDDYWNRYNPLKSFMPSDAAKLLKNFLTGRPHIVGAVPNFDTERISHQLLRPNGIGELWNYHLIDVENLAVGKLYGQMEMLEAVSTASPVRLAGPEHLLRELLTPPWDSNALSRALGVNPDQFDRHTAMGDVHWVMAQYDAVTGKR